MRRKDQQPYMNFGSSMGIPGYKYIWERNDTKNDARTLQHQGKATLNMHHGPKIFRWDGSKKEDVGGDEGSSSKKPSTSQ